MNYVPYLGPAVVIGTLAVVSLLNFPTLQEAVVAPLSYLAIVTIEGQFITPTLMGRRLEINPFAVFLAIAFCTWLWGPMGAFLAVPLLMAMSVTFEHIFSEEQPDLPSEWGRRPRKSAATELHALMAGVSSGGGCTLARQ